MIELSLISKVWSDSQSDSHDDGSTSTTTHLTKNIKRSDLPKKFALHDCLSLILEKSINEQTQGFDPLIMIDNQP